MPLNVSKTKTIVFLFFTIVLSVTSVAFLMGEKIPQNIKTTKNFAFTINSQLLDGGLIFRKVFKRHNQFILAGYHKLTNKIILLTDTLGKKLGEVNLNNYPEIFFDLTDEVVELIYLNHEKFLIRTQYKLTLLENKTIIWSKYLPEIFGDSLYPISNKWFENNHDFINGKLVGNFGGLSNKVEKNYPFDFEIFYVLDLITGQAEILPFKNPNYGTHVFKLSHINWLAINNQFYVNYGINNVIHKLNETVLDSFFLSGDVKINHGIRYEHTPNPKSQFLRELASAVKYSDMYYNQVYNTIVCVKYIPIWFEEDGKNFKSKNNVSVEFYDKNFNLKSAIPLPSNHLSLITTFIDNVIIFSDSITTTDSLKIYRYKAFEYQ